MTLSKKGASERLDEEFIQQNMAVFLARKNRAAGKPIDDPKVEKEVNDYVRRRLDFLETEVKKLRELVPNH